MDAAGRKRANLLIRMASMPFATRSELQRVSRISVQRTLYRQLHALERQGLIDSFSHDTSHARYARRYCLTAAGARAVASALHVPMSDILRRFPLSASYLRNIYRRMDALTSIYGLAAKIADARDAFVETTLYKAGAWDAAIRYDKTVIAVFRNGEHQPDKAIASRIWRLQTGLNIPDALFVLSSNVEQTARLARILGDHITRMPCFVVLERDVIARSIDALVWHFASDLGIGMVSLREVLGVLSGQGEAPAQELEMRPRPLRNAELQKFSDGYNELTAQGKRLLDLSVNWPLLQAAHAEEMMGVGYDRMYKLRKELSDEGLIVNPKIMADLRNPRIAPTVKGLTAVAYRDRVSVGKMRSRLNPQRDAQGLFYGSVLRKAEVQLEHNDAVHALAGQMMADSIPFGMPEPPTLISTQHGVRSFRVVSGYREYTHSIYPDMAGSVIWPSGLKIQFSFEWERRATTPYGLARKIRPYVAYYRSGRQRVDFGRDNPLVLFCFELPSAEANFLKVAGPHRVAFASTTKELLISEGPYEPIWKLAGDPDFNLFNLAEAQRVFELL